jgi:uncharacterized damage-inducible protein DinB
MTVSENLQYPIGKYKKPEHIDAGQRERFIQEIAAAPKELRKAVEGLNESQLNTPYREGGWTVRQVVHHLPDSHMNAYVRLKLALTEHEPAVKTYEEALWSELPDVKTVPIEISLALLDALHVRWIACLRGLVGDAFEKKFWHPAMGFMSLNEQLALYAWHGKHHVAHITSLRQRMGWK